MSASKYGFLNFQLTFLPQNQKADPKMIMNHVGTVHTYHLQKGSGSETGQKQIGLYLHDHLRYLKHVFSIAYVLKSCKGNHSQNQCSVVAKQVKKWTGS